MGDLGETTVDGPPKIMSRQGEELLNTIDQIRALGISRYIDIPQIVVCGDQSSGKSSVLEAVCGLKFEVGDGLCTTFATEYILRRSDGESVAISINPSPDLIDDTRKDRLLAWKPSTNSLDRFQTIMTEAKEAMLVGKDGNNFSQHRLRIEVSGPTQPHLSLVDVPGLFHTPGPGQTMADRDAVTALVKGYIRNPRSIIMAVMSAKNDPELQATLTHTQEQDPDGERTIGVITKPDTLSKNSPNEERYLGLARNKDENTSAQFKLGWAAVRNRSFEERDCTASERDENERRFFDEGVWKSLDPSLKGIAALRLRLGKILHDHIVTELPSMVKDVEAGVAECEQKLETLGSSRATYDEQRLFLHRASSQYKSLMSASTDGIYSDPFFGSAATELDYHKRIRAVSTSILSDFEDEMQRHGHATAIVSDLPKNYKHKLGTPQKVLAEDFYLGVKTRMRRNGGRELPGLFNPAIIKSLFLDQCKPWYAIVARTLDDLLDATRTTARLVLEQVADEATIDKILPDIVNPRMEPVERELRLKVEAFLKPILNGHPVTFNHYFIENIQKKREDEQRKELSERLHGFLGVDPKDNNTIDRQYDGKFDVRSLLDALVKSTEKDMERFAAIEATNAMLAYYKVALKRIIDDFAIYVIEESLLSKLPSLFDPEVVLGLEKDAITKIAGESEASMEERRALTSKLAALKETQKLAQRMDRHKPQDLAIRRKLSETQAESDEENENASDDDGAA